MSHWGSDGAGAPALHKGLQVDCSAPECACACEDVVHDSDCPQALPNQLLIADVSDSAVWTASRVYNESVREGANHPVAMHAALMAVARRPASRDELAAEVEPWLQQCGPCDAGLPMGCSHPDGDYRVILSKVWGAYEHLMAAGKPTDEKASNDGHLPPVR